MVKLHIVQAEFGDCFILESKSNNESTTMLIDGGPYQTFKNHLKPTLQKLPLNGKIDLIVLSHIDNDHIIGLLDLFLEIKNERDKGIKELVKIKKCGIIRLRIFYNYLRSQRNYLQVFSHLKI